MKRKIIKNDESVKEKPIEHYDLETSVLYFSNFLNHCADYFGDEKSEHLAEVYKRINGLINTLYNLNIMLTAELQGILLDSEPDEDSIISVLALVQKCERNYLHGF